IFTSETGLTNDWQDYGWAPRTFAAGGPATVDLSKKGGWIIGKPDASTEFGGLKLKFQAPPELGDFLEVRVDAKSAVVFPRILVGPKHRRDLPDRWSEVWISMADLDPRRAPFDRVVLRSNRDLPKGTQVRFDEIAFTGQDSGDAGTAKAERAAPIEVRMTVDCLLPGHPINPMIYGIAFKPSHDATDKHQWLLGAGARRWGGNPTSRYNWVLGNAWNTASDWFFRNVNYTPNPRYTYDLFLEDDIAHGVKTALTVPTLGWVAKDVESVGFPASVFGQQQYMEGPKVGNGIGKDGKPLPPGPPTLTSIPAPPSFVEKWVRTIRSTDARRGRSVHMYILDNEPALWNSTHRDVHPEPVTYDELLDRLIKYGGAVRKADPEAVIAGPAEWGWPGYFFSAKDQAAGFALRPDRLAHLNKPLIPWLLSELREHREDTGERILDVLDVHYYPQHEGAGIGAGGKTDPYSAALRIRSTRSLWDPTYVDESWINDTIRLFPRLKQWIKENDPGLGISIGEWNFGAENHMSGGLATAEALGRFGVEGITSAFYWDYPADRSPSFWAFRAYRNFDGAGGRFLDRHVPTTSGYELASVYASRNDSGDHMVLVLLNDDPTGPLNAKLDLSSCGTVVSSKAYSYAGGPQGFAPAQADPRGGVTAVEQRLEAYSMTVLDLTMQPVRRGQAGR
ncbi:MAG TPA: glycoside hydrolase family 44 protein, partial [Myxococcales bacterium]|nr:glycoside hydrolase family 44 protein [Myxococcales bacterium]